MGLPCMRHLGMYASLTRMAVMSLVILNYTRRSWKKILVNADIIINYTFGRTEIEITVDFKQSGTQFISISNFLIWSELDAVNRAGELLPGKNQPIQWLTWLLRIPTILQCLHFRTGLLTKVMHFEIVIWHRSHHIICLKVGRSLHRVFIFVHSNKAFSFTLQSHYTTRSRYFSKYGSHVVSSSI